MGRRLQWAVQNVATGSIMGFPNGVLSSREAAMASYQWLTAEQKRKREEYEADPSNPQKEHAWLQVADHVYAIKCRETNPWRDPPE